MTKSGHIKPHSEQPSVSSFDSHIRPTGPISVILELSLFTVHRTIGDLLSEEQSLPHRTIGEIFDEEENLYSKLKDRYDVLEKNMISSEALGMLWTVHAAIYPDAVEVFLCHGKKGSEYACLRGMNGWAPVVFGPLHIIGKTYGEAIIETAMLFTGDKVTIKTLA